MTTTDTVTDAAEAIEAKPSGQPGQRQKTGTVTGTGRVVGYWASTTEAATRLGVSERTIRRRAKDGQLPSRLWGGRRQVRLDPPDAATDTPDAEPDNQATEGGQLGQRQKTGTDAAELAMLVRGVIERRDADTRQELRRARRWAGFGVATAAALVIAAAIGAVWAVQAIERAATAAGVAEARAEATEATRAAEAALATAERERAERLADELIDARADARAAEAMIHAATIEALTRTRTDSTPDSWATVPTGGSIIRID